MQFDTKSIVDDLKSVTEQQGWDALDFGVIGINDDDEVVIYNAAEQKLAGLTREDVIGSDFFSEVAPCMNNYMVSGRFDDEDTLDDTVDYVLTLRMKPTRVKLRLIKSAELDARFIFVERSAAA